MSNWLGGRDGARKTPSLISLFHTLNKIQELTSTEQPKESQGMKSEVVIFSDSFPSIYN